MVLSRRVEASEYFTYPGSPSTGCAMATAESRRATEATPVSSPTSSGCGGVRCRSYGLATTRRRRCGCWSPTGGTWWPTRPARSDPGSHLTTSSGCPMRLSAPLLPKPPRWCRRGGEDQARPQGRDSANMTLNQLVPHSSCPCSAPPLRPASASRSVRTRLMTAVRSPPNLKSPLSRPSSTRPIALALLHYRVSRSQIISQPKGWIRIGPTPYN